MAATLLRIVAVAGTLALVPRSGAADAAHPTVSLGLTRAPGAEACITAHELALQVEDRLGRGVFVSAAQAELFIDARIARRGRGWHATVSASRASGAAAGARELDTRSGDCRELDPDLVLVVALVIDPTARPAARATALPSARLPATPATGGVAAIYVPVVVTVEDAVRWELGGRLASTLLVSRLPGASPAIEIAVLATAPRAWPVELGALVSTRARAEDSGRGADVRLALGTLAVCPVLWTRNALRGQACGGAALGAMLVRPRALDPIDASTSFVADVMARLQGTTRLAGPVAVVAELGAMVPLIRRRLTYTALDPITLEVVRHEAYAVPAVGWTATLGVGVQFR